MKIVYFISDIIIELKNLPSKELLKYDTFLDSSLKGQPNVLTLAQTDREIIHNLKLIVHRNSESSQEENKTTPIRVSISTTYRL